MEFTVEANRIYYAQGEKLLAEITFPLHSEGVVNINHTFVDPSLRGQGVAGKLVLAAIAVLEEKGWKAVASCPYVVEWFVRNPEYNHLLAA